VPAAAGQHLGHAPQLAADERLHERAELGADVAGSNREAERVPDTSSISWPGRAFMVLTIMVSNLPRRRDRARPAVDRPPVVPDEGVLGSGSVIMNALALGERALDAGPRPLHALVTALAPYYAPGENLVRAAFLDPRLRDRREDWDRAAAATVAALRGARRPRCRRPPG
jgi:hypothetical protein